jgi:hypothetical protein
MTALFRNNGQNKVGMRFRQIKQFLHSVPDSYAKSTSRSERQQGLDNLKTGIARILPGIQKCSESCQSVPFMPDKPDTDRNKRRPQNQKMLYPGPGQAQHRKHDGGDNYRRAEIRFQ